MHRLRHLLWLPVPFLLYWALKDLQFRELFANLRRLAPFQIAVLLAVNIIFVMIITLRWAVILHGLGAPLSLFRLLGYRLAGYAVSYLTPGPQFGGEPLQLYLAKHNGKLSYDLGSASILLDKSFELLGNFTFLGIASLVILPLGILGSGDWYAAIPVPSLLIALPASYLAAIFSGLRPLSRILARLPTVLHGRPGFQKTLALIGSSETRMVAYCRRRGRTLLQILLFFLLVWIASLFEMRLVLHYLGISLSLRQALLVLAGIKVAFLLPFPGALGALELTCLGVFELLGYDPETAMSLVLYMRVRDLVFAAGGLAAAAGAWRRRKPINSQSPRP